VGLIYINRWRVFFSIESLSHVRLARALNPNASVATWFIVQRWRFFIWMGVLMDTAYLTELIPLAVDYLCHLTGDPAAVASLTQRVLANVADVPAPLSREEARIQVLALATVQARLHNSTQTWIETPPNVLTNKAAQKAQESIWHAAGQLSVLHRAALVLSDLLDLDELQIARIVRLPVSETTLLIAAARAEFNGYLAHIVKARAQFPLDKIAPALALGLKARHGHSHSALALLPVCRLSDEQIAVIRTDVEYNARADNNPLDAMYQPHGTLARPAPVM
jgi:hypothetical protein